MSNAKKVLLVVASAIILILMRHFVPGINYIFNNWLISPFTYALLTFLIYKAIPRNARNREAKIKRKTMFILTAIYLIVFLLTGLFVEFVRSPYWGKYLVIIQSLFKFASIVICQEMIRNKLVTNCPKKKRYYLLIVLIFFAWGLDFKNLASGLTKVDYVFNNLLVAFATQIFLTYVSFDCGLDSVLVNQLMTQLIFYFVPIYPDIDWFYLGMYNIIMYVIFYFVINYESVALDRWVRRGAVKKENPLVYVILLSLLILLVGFQLSFFKYYPTAIVTNSMKPDFIRGDAVVVKKLDEKDILNLKIGDIIEYKNGNRSIVHRIIAIDDSDKEYPLFTTKGDYNNGPDPFQVEKHQIKGTVQFSIPYIGYPSVYFIEFFDKSRPDGIETGE